MHPAEMRQLQDASMQREFLQILPMDQLRIQSAAQAGLTCSLPAVQPMSESRPYSVLEGLHTSISSVLYHCMTCLQLQAALCTILNRSGSQSLHFRHAFTLMVMMAKDHPGESLLTEWNGVKWLDPRRAGQNSASLNRVAFQFRAKTRRTDAGADHPEANGAPPPSGSFSWNHAEYSASVVTTHSVMLELS